MKQFLAISGVAVAIGLASVVPASASSITIGFTNGSRSADAVFANVGGNLVVTLTNTSGSDALVPTDLLTAIFFDVAGNPSLTGTSADICATCTVLNAPAVPTDPSPDGVGGEWAYSGGSSTLAFGANYALSSTGLGIFGTGDLFPGANLAGPDDPDGPQYGITTAGDDPLTGNGGLAVPIIQNQVVFKLGGFGSLDPSRSISKVTFLYGTALDEPSFGGSCIGCGVTTQDAVPEPASLLLLGSGLAFTAKAIRRRRS